MAEDGMRRESDFEDDRKGLVDDDDELQETMFTKILEVLTSRTAGFLYLALVCLGLGLLVPLWFLHYYPLDVEMPIYTRGSCMIAPSYRFPCLVGEQNVTDRRCANAGCCWYNDTSSAGNSATCFHSLPASYTFKLNTSTVNSSALEAELTAYSFADHAAGRVAHTPYGTAETPRLRARASCPSADHAVLDLGPAAVGDEPKPVVVDGPLSIRSNVGDDWDFYFVVTRNSTGQPLVDTRLGATIVSPLFTELTLVPASSAVYGLGQAFHPNLRRAFNSSVGSALFARPVAFTEGFHPFYMCIEPDGAVHGVYLETTAPLEVQLLPGPSITLRLLEGRVRLHVFAGPTAAAVSEQYTRLVGRPRLPPLWSLGFHMCRQGDAVSFQAVVETMVNHSIPFESDCVDADALVPLGFEAAPELAAEFRDGGSLLRAQGRHLMAYAVPQLPLHRQPLGEDAPDPYEPYEQADGAGILVRNENDTGNFFGELHEVVGNRTWNVSYVDYSNSATAAWLKPLYSQLIADYEIDGFYLMRNSPANDAADDCPGDKLPFVPNVGESHTLSNDTVCMSARHSSGQAHLGQHNRYGLEHASAARAAAADARPDHLLTSASTAPGSGAAGAHLAAGLSADWTSLQLALVQTLELGLYGVPQAGYPVCGTRNSTRVPADDADRLEALCLLWYQLAPYLPLAVSFYEAGHFARNPPQLSDAFLNQALVHISQRYVFVPYHYSLLVEAARSGVPPLRPLWYEFAEDNATWSIDQQLLLGPALMVAPALVENQRKVRLYLPGSCWYEYFQGYRPKAEAGPGWVTLPVPAQQTLIYQRAASVIFNQRPFTTIEDQRKNGTYSATIALSCEGNYTAFGSLYLPAGDDAISPQKVELTVSNTSVTIVSELDEPFCDSYRQNGYTSLLAQVKIFGIMEEVTSLTEVLTDRNGATKQTALSIDQGMRPPQLLINAPVFDWCQYAAAEISWE
ncbi:maltase-glucoamylase, intestinal-like [Pollicipes pollicipes]|uniref:maltase-glucoamylase, intestinal-like n=1 Tax=Pollicipes pollicipes TaxID=41117 RepID=UPI001884DC9D|nr:maltase-glucoamylase, intestinal-like [Pollicipes pollicipes]